MMTPSKARYTLEALAGPVMREHGMYYAVGVEVPPRHGATFSVRYVQVPSARAGWALLRRKLANKRVGTIGELVAAVPHTTASVSLGGYIRRGGGTLEPFCGDKHRRALSRSGLAKFAASLRAL